ncbi:hypothetical protein JCM11251_002392 [Rhodosporidiobolus azoricus]
MPVNRTSALDPDSSRFNPIRSTGPSNPPPSPGSSNLAQQNRHGQGNGQHQQNQTLQTSGQQQQTLPTIPPVPISRNANSLGRGRACRRCRQRKVKCDGRQLPCCTPCEVLAMRMGQHFSTVVCDFDTEEERKKPVGGGKVSGLEAKIAELEQRIQELTEGKEERVASSPSSRNAYSPAPSSASLPAQPQPAQQPTPASSHPYHPSKLSPPVDPGFSPMSPYSPAFPTRPAAFPAPGPALPLPQFFPSPSAFAPPPAFPPSSAFPLQPSLAHRQSGPPPYPFFSGGPLPPEGPYGHHAALPSPNEPLTAQGQPPIAQLAHNADAPISRLPSWPTLRRLVNTFFDYPHEAVDLINRKRFMARFERPAEDPEFPSQCLLHAMVATASDLIGEEAAFEGEERYWPEGMKPSLWHADQADRLIPLSFRKERNLLQVAQAAVLFAATNLAHGRFARSFLETSTAVRICVALGLNHVGTTERHLPLSNAMSGRTSLVVPKDDEDLQERAATFWFAYTVEVVSSAATGWACCLDERDITTLLPAAAPYESDPISRESLYLHAPNFFTTNPPNIVRLVQINLKSIVLMNRVITFVHRTSALANVASDNSPTTPSPMDHGKIRASSAFQKLEAALEAFQRRAPNQLIALLEPQAFLLPALTSTSVILLHESLTTGEEGCISMAKCNEAANVMLQNMHVLNNASFHPRHIPPFLSFCYLVCGRTFIREIALKQARGNAEEADIARLTHSVQTVIERLKASRTPLGPKAAISLSALLSKPDIALPIGVGQSGYSPGGLPPLAQLLSLMDPEGRAEAELCA